MAASRMRQFILLIWKTWTLQKRRPVFTLFEIAVPLFFALLLLVIRTLAASDDMPAEAWPPFSVDQINHPPPQLLYSPQKPVIDQLMADINSTLVFENTTVIGFKSADDLEEYRNSNKDIVWAGVIFDESQNYTTALPKNVNYTLRVKRIKKDDKWSTQMTYPFFQAPGYRNNDTEGGEPNYYTTGFLTLQYLVDRAIVNFSAPGSTAKLNIRLQKMPYPPFVKDNLLPNLQQNLPLFLMLGFILSVLQTMKNILYEKEHKLKEAMKMMGLNSTIYWSSWFLKTLVFLVVACIIYTIFFAISVPGKGSVLNRSDPTLVFVFLLCYSISITGFCFMMTTFFNKANTGANVGGVVYFLFYVPYFIVYQFYQDMSKSEKMLLSLLNQCGMALGVNTISLYEGAGKGARWSNFYQPATVDDNFTLLEAMIMLLVDSAIYFLITWYVSNISPGEYGVPRPWYFPLTVSYWCGKTPKSDSYEHVRPVSSVSTTFENEPTGLKTGISIKHLRKEFGHGKQKKVAVADMNLNMYKGQITALLGHNGAGKTTTMSMLTGFIPPSKGTATVNGYDITTDILHVRQSLGLCPQHNILFDTLTVQEHLEFFAEIKGCPKSKLKQEVDDMIEVLNMSAKRTNQAKTLSGGQKRKLSVGIALIAGSKVVILDEPSSGMDPAARRETWDILQKSREGRTLVLTTHFMDEADLLGDRIAIMAEGVVKCCGTSLFLKKAYGAGYHLVIVKDKSCDVDTLTKFIQSHIPTATVESDISAELTYLLPFDQSPKFEKLFEETGNKEKELGISSFGTSATTMEEVFLKVADTQNEESHEEGKENYPFANGVTNPSYAAVSSNSLNGNGSFSENFSRQNGLKPATSNGAALKQSASDSQFVQFNANLRKNTGSTLVLQQFFGMFVKKAIHFLRNRVVTLVQLLLPVIFTILALMTEKIIPKLREEDALLLNLANFAEGNVITYANTDNGNIVSSNLTQIYSNSFAGQYDTRRIDISANSFGTELLKIMKDIGEAPFDSKYIIGGEFFGDNLSEISSIAYFNGEPFHSPAITLNSMMDVVLKYFTDEQHSISTTNHPFPRSLEDNTLSLGFSVLGTSFIITFDILFGMAFLSTSFIIFLIKERSNGAKHLQKVSGVSTLSYWLSNYLWDLINFTLPVLLIMIVFAAFGTDAYTEDNHLAYIFLLFMVYGMACLPFVYVLHFMFTVPATGMVVVTMFNIITGLATTMAVFVLRVPPLGTADIAKALDWIFTILIPHYCLGQGLTNLYSNHEFLKSCTNINYKVFCSTTMTEHPCCKDKCGTNCIPFTEEPLGWESPGIAKYFVFMALQCICFFFFIWLVENNFFYKLVYLFKQKDNSVNGSTLELEERELNNLNNDSDVIEEHKRIHKTTLTSLMESDTLIMKSLVKKYENFTAVKGISVGIQPQQCFGLLGQNGAGKTSTFKMLTGSEIVTSGNAYVNGYDIKNNMRLVHQNLGYCPQFDALIAQMTGREILTMFARLRGVEESQIKMVVNELLDIMMLRKYADKNCDVYSGGNKRKLSTAIALIGDPPFVLLDEPTTGMDPGARRQLWNVLSQVRASGRTLILTSHSMEECDALCTKIVIMVNGKFVCLGSPQHLKNKFGHGYTLIVRPDSKSDQKEANVNALKNLISDKFPDSQIFDDHQGYMHFQIPDSNIPLYKVFGVMEKAKIDCGVEDYSVHQTTLEQVFLTFTKNQIAPPEK